jgi:4,5-dihydroxyphthalate decarboxylase
VLQAEYGVDLSSITWVRTGEEHVARYQPPPNVATEIGGATVAERVASGELSAAVGITAHDGLVPLIPDPQQAGYDALRERGLYPINHLIVVRDDVLAARPGLAEELFAAFSESKHAYLDQLFAGAISAPTAADELHLQVHQITGGDPLPYGLEPNRATIETLIGHAVDQRIVAARPKIEDLFARDTLGLAG